MRVSITAVALLLVLAGCSDSAENIPPTNPPATSTSGTSPDASSSTSTTGTSSIAPTTPTATLPSTTTTVAPLDTGDTATLERLQHDLDVLLSNGPRVSGTPWEAAAVRYFAFRAQAITGRPSTIQRFPLPNATQSANAWAAAVGSGERILLLGSHLDSIAGSPGADDNGSGTVLLLELLRRLAERPPEDLRVVVVGFGAEEYIPGHDHHYGSDYAVAEMSRDGLLPDFMVSVDMVGVGDRIHAVDYGGLQPSMADLLVEVAEQVGVDMIRRSRGDISDHVPFAVAGVPAALMWRGDNPKYHQAGDDDVEPEAMLEDLRILIGLIELLDGFDE